MGLEAKANADTLSHQSMGGKDKKTPKSLIIILIQLNSIVVVAKALYSASVEDLDTVSYFLVDQLIGELPKNTTILVIDFLSENHQPNQHHNKLKGPKDLPESEYHDAKYPWDI